MYKETRYKDGRFEIETDPLKVYESFAYDMINTKIDKCFSARITQRFALGSGQRVITFHFKNGKTIYYL